MLTFITYELLKSPSAYTKLRQEVDSVLGTGENSRPIRPEDVSKLPYLIAVMREALRLHPPAPAIGVTPFEDTVIGGKYLIKKGWVVAVQSACLHRDPVVWGDDVSESPEKFQTTQSQVSHSQFASFNIGRRIQTRTYDGRQVRSFACKPVLTLSFIRL